MRAIAIDANEHGRLGSLLDEMHQLRARVFAGRLGWQVRIAQGRERDEYDALDPTYILALTDCGDVAGCARLLPTTGPTMLSWTCGLPTTGAGRSAAGQANQGRELALLRRHKRGGQGTRVPARSDADDVCCDHRVVGVERLRRDRHRDGCSVRTHPATGGLADEAPRRCEAHRRDHECRRHLAGRPSQLRTSLPGRLSVGPAAPSARRCVSDSDRLP